VRRLVVLLCSLCTVGPASAGVVSPDTVAASAPQWVGDHVIAFEYSQSSYVGRWHEVRDDGTGFAPTAAPPPTGGPTGAVARGTKLYGSDGRLLVSDASPQFGFAVSPDGSQIVFAAWSGWGNQRGAALYVASTSGADASIRRLTPDVCTVVQFAHTAGSLCLDGTDGPDRLAGTKRGDLVIAGAGDDVVHAGDGQNVVYGQWGDDTILSGSYVDTAYGGGGNDVIRTGAGEDSIFPGPGRDVVGAGRGPDHLIANDGERDVIDCGPGDDRARADRVDVVRNCEHVTVVS
jgi:Ca2+-binding RTX toxin-like protein